MEHLREYGQPSFVVTEGRKVDPEYEKIRAQQRSLKRSQVESDLVGTMLFLSSPESDFMTGQLLNVDGGFHFVGQYDCLGATAKAFCAG